MKKSLLFVMMFGLVLALVPSMALAASPKAAQKTGKYVFEGTAAKAKDPTGVRPVNHVISMDTSAAGSFALAWRYVQEPVADLTDRINLHYYLVDRSCGGGSPRVQLALDTDGDGTSNGNAFGYVGSAPFGAGCTTNAWTHENLTDAVARWDLSQLGGSPAMTWASVVAAYGSAEVITGALVDDSSWMPAAAGLAYFDNVQIGNRTYRGPQDMIG